jgi:hypothetical protein
LGGLWPKSVSLYQNRVYEAGAEVKAKENKLRLTRR